MTCWKLLVGVLVGCLISVQAGSIPTVLAFDFKRSVELSKETNRLLQKADYKGALKAAQEMEACCESNRECLAFATYWLGACNLDLGRLDVAAEKLQEAERSLSALRFDEDAAIATYQLGRVFALTGDYTQAMQLFKRADQKLKGKEERAKLYSARANVLSETGNPEAAREDVDRARRNLKDPNLLAMLDLQEAVIDLRIQNYGDARSSYDKALDNFGDRHPPNLAGIAQALSGLGQIDESQGNYPAAENNYNNALRSARDAGSRSAEAYVLNNLGSLNWKRGNYKAALEYYEEALQIQESLGQKHLVPNTLNNIGLVYLGQADYQRAMDYFTDAYARATEVGRRELQAWALHDMAFVYKDQGEFLKSQEEENKAIGIAMQILNKRLEATARLRLGNLYEYFGNFDLALKEYKKAAKIQSEINDQLFRSNTLVSQAEIFLRKVDAAMPDESEAKKNIQDAEALFEEAQRIKSAIGAPMVELLCKYALFHIEKPRYGWTGNREHSLKKARELIGKAKDKLGPDARNDALLLAYTEARYDLERSPEKSIDGFSRVDSLAKDAGSLRFSFLANVGTGLAAEKLERFDEAKVAYQAAIDYAEKLRETLTPDQRRTFLHGEEILGIKHALPYEGLARVNLMKDDRKASLHASERTKARSFADKLGGKGARLSAQVDPALLKRLDEVERNIRTSYQRLQKVSAAQGDATTVQQLNGEITVLQREQNDLQQSVRSEDPEFHATRFAGYVRLDEFELAPDEWAICYEVTDSGVIIFLIQGKQLVDSWFERIPRRELTELVRKFREPLQIKGEFRNSKLLSFEEAMPVGRKLWDILIASPIKHIPKGQPIIISPDDVLGLLPFEALVQETGTGWKEPPGRPPYPEGARYLADRNDVTYCQSITALSLSRRRRGKAGSGTRNLVVVDPVFQKKDPRLMKLKSEERKQALNSLPGKLMSFAGMEWPRLEITEKLARIFEQFDKQDSDVYQGLQAEKSLLVGKDLNNYKWMVFATHGYFGTELPGIREPIIVFTLVGQPQGQDGLLRMNEVMDLHMNADVVALTCCQTGLGQFVSGEGSMSMGRAFRYAGAESVLMSLWNVSEKQSVELVGKFFSHLEAGKGRSESLKLARQEIRNAGYEHPFFWGAFVLAGER